MRQMKKMAAEVSLYLLTLTNLNLSRDTYQSKFISWHLPISSASTLYKPDKGTCCLSYSHMVAVKSWGKYGFQTLQRHNNSNSSMFEQLVQASNIKTKKNIRAPCHRPFKANLSMPMYSSHNEPPMTIVPISWHYHERCVYSGCFGWYFRHYIHTYIYMYVFIKIISDLSRVQDILTTCIRL